MSESKKITVNHEEVAEKLIEMLKPSGWHNLLKGFLYSEDFKNILIKLNECVDEGQRFTPPLKQVFRAFVECPLSDLSVVMVGQDPYPQMGVADGVAFSCSNTGKQEASMRYIFNAIGDTVYKGKVDPKKMDTDLARWSKQGVLMLNTALTTEIGKVGKHYDIWKPFINYLFDMLNTHESTIWVFMGKKAEDLSDLIDSDKHHHLFCSHPASAAYQKESKWNCNDVFNKVNETLETQNKPTIIW